MVFLIKGGPVRFTPDLIKETKDYFFEEKGIRLTDKKADEYLYSFTQLGLIIFEQEKRRRNRIDKNVK